MVNHTTRRDKLQLGLILCLLIYMTAGAAAAAGAAGAKPPGQGAVHNLPFNGNDFVIANPSGTMLAVTKTGRLVTSAFTGTGLDVWSIGRDLNPSKLLFEDRENVLFSPRTFWVGDTLLYGTQKKLSRQELDDKFTADPVAALSNFQGYKWTLSEAGRKPFAAGMETFLLPTLSGRQFLVFSPVATVIKQITADRSGYPAPAPRPKSGKRSVLADFVPTVIPVDIHNLNDNPARRIYLPVRRPEVDRMSSDFLPIFVDPTGKKLVAALSGNEAWRAHGQPLDPHDFLVSINLVTRLVTPLTSAEDSDALWPIYRRRFFGPGMPTPVHGGQQVVCALNAESRNLAYRFQYFTVDGKLVKDLEINDRDVKRAGLPAHATPISWSDNGNVLLQASSDVYFYDVGTKKAVCLANNIIVNDVIGWAGPQRLLARFYKASARFKNAGGLLDSDMQWGFIQIP